MKEKEEEEEEEEEAKEGLSNGDLESQQVE
jgi:hypothetical protein